MPADAARRQLTFTESISGLRQRAGRGVAVGSGERLDYVIDLGDMVRLVVLDIVRRGGGSGGEIDPGQPAWLARQLGAAGDRWVVVITHQPLLSRSAATAAGGDGPGPAGDRRAQRPHPPQRGRSPLRRLPGATG